MPNRHRSVNDFDSEAELRRALTVGENPTADWMLPHAVGGESVGDPSQSVEEEWKRLCLLKQHLGFILDNDAANQDDSTLTRMTNLAARMMNAPIAMISLVDVGRQYFVQTRGVSTKIHETSRRASLAAHTILSPHDVLVVSDLTQDDRFSQFSLVTEAPQARFYAGAPLVLTTPSTEGESHRMGSLCILDTKPRPEGLTWQEKQNLRELAALVMETMLHRNLTASSSSSSPVAGAAPSTTAAHGQATATSHAAAALSAKRATMTAHDLLAPITSMQQNLLRALADSENNRELLISFLRCSEVMTRICHTTIYEDNGGGDGTGEGQSDEDGQEEEDLSSSSLSPPPSPKQGENEEKDQQDLLPPSLSLSVPKSSTSSYSSSSSSVASPTAIISRLVEDIEGVISPYPKRVYLKMDMGRDLLLNETEMYVGNDLKVTRCAINLLVHACDRADRGQVSCRMFCKDEWLVVEVEDYGPAVPIEDYPTLFQEPENACHNNKKRRRRRNNAAGGGYGGLSSSFCSGFGLWSVADNIDSLGGDYGYYTKEEQDNRNCNPGEEEEVGNVFWFSVPTTRPNSANCTAAATNDASLPPAVSNVDGAAEGDEGAIIAATTDSTPPMTPPTPKKQQLHPVIGKREYVVEKDSMISRVTDESIQHQEPPISVPMGDNDDNDLYNMDMTMSRSVSVASLAVAAGHTGGTTAGTDAITERSKDQERREGERNASKRDEEAVTISTKQEKGSHSFTAASKTRKTANDNDDEDEDEKKDSYEEQLLSSVQDVHYEGTIGSTTVFQRRRQRQGRVLVVDDSITVRKNIDRTLSRLGYCVVQASNGMQGLKELQAAVFDVVLVDFLMPVMDGIDCVLQYRQWEAENRQGYRQYVVGISAHGNDSAIVEKGLDAGMDKFLPKPVSSAIVKQLCDSDELEKASEALDAYLLDEEEKSSGGLESDDDSVRAGGASAVIKEEGMSEEIAKEETEDGAKENSEAKETKNAEEATIEESANGTTEEETATTAANTNNRRESAISSSPPCCLIGMNSKPAAVALSRNIEARGWRASIVANGSDALRLLKMRRWDAVFLDEKMPRLSGPGCVSKFRDWEAANGRGDGGERRQDHVYLLHERYHSSSTGRGAAIMPAGADGVIGKPLRTKDLTRVLTKAGRGATTTTSARNNASLAAAATTAIGGGVPRRRSMQMGSGGGGGVAVSSGGSNGSGAANRGNVRGMMKSLSKRILLK